MCCTPAWVLSLSALSAENTAAACLRILRENLLLSSEWELASGKRAASRRFIHESPADPSLWSAQPAVQPLQRAQRRSINANKVSLARTILHGARGEKQLTQHAPRAHTAKGQRYIYTNTRNMLFVLPPATMQQVQKAREIRIVLENFFLLCT